MNNKRNIIIVFIGILLIIVGVILTLFLSNNKNKNTKLTTTINDNISKNINIGSGKNILTNSGNINTNKIVNIKDINVEIPEEISKIELNDNLFNTDNDLFNLLDTLNNEK